jgi:hypothetical protein
MRTRFASLRVASFLPSRDGVNPHFAYARGSGHGGRRYPVLPMNQTVSRLYAYERRWRIFHQRIEQITPLASHP